MPGGEPHTVLELNVNKSSEQLHASVVGDRRTSLKVSLVDYKPDSESAWEIVEFYSEGCSMAPDLSFEEASTKRCVRGESINLEH